MCVLKLQMWVRYWIDILGYPKDILGYPWISSGYPWISLGYPWISLDIPGTSFQRIENFYAQWDVFCIFIQWNVSNCLRNCLKMSHIQLKVDFQIFFQFFGEFWSYGYKTDIKRISSDILGYPRISLYIRSNIFINNACIFYTTLYCTLGVWSWVCYSVVLDILDTPQSQFITFFDFPLCFGSEFFWICFKYM